VVQHADRLQSTVQDQALEIQSLQTHIGHLEKEIEALKNPSYDQIFAYIDRQVQHVTEDTERKLTIKADKREMETVIPQRLEDLYRTLNRKVQDLKVDVARTATKEELIAIAQTKVTPAPTSLPPHLTLPLLPSPPLCWSVTGGAH
jgi:predicted metal-dependent hydrolase